jgi:hypothetical protein
LVTILTVSAGIGVVRAQDRDWRDRDWRDRDEWRDRDSNSWRNNDYGYQEGLRQGQYDRSRNARFDYRNREWRRGDDNFRRAYQNGYQQGYNSGYGYRDYGGNYGNYGGYGNYGNYGNYGRYGNGGYAQGLADGRSDGIHDLNTGHSYRPTEGGNYKHADHGYNSSFGNKNAYKDSYRQGYMAGYDEGYRRRY